MHNGILENISLSGTVNSVFLERCFGSDLLFLEFQYKNSSFIINIPLYSALNPLSYQYIGKFCSISILKYTINNISRFKLVNIYNNVKEIV